MERLGTMAYMYVPFKIPAVGRKHVTIPAGTANPIAAGVPQSGHRAEERGEVSVNKPFPVVLCGLSLIVCSLS